MRKEKKWNPAVCWKWSVLKNLTYLANKLRVEAVFPEDFRDLEKLDDAMRLINAYNLQPYSNGLCPLCGSASVIEAEVHDVEFHAIGKASPKLDKVEGLKIRKCEKCGAVSVDRLHRRNGG